MTTEPETVAAPAGKMEAFAFGEPAPVLDRRELLDYIQCLDNGKWYETPISFDGLAKTFRCSPHHASCIYVKRNILVSTFEPSPVLSRAEFSRFVLEYLIFGNAYVERHNARSGKLLTLKALPARYVRRGSDLDTYWYVRGWKDEQAFAKGAVFHLMEPDINQEIYGLPEYLSALNATWLNESATLFRRRYYKNGSHAGFILYMTDAAQSEDDITALRTALRDSKGPGNFRNLFMYAPSGKKDGIQIIPVAEVAAKDEFWNIKNTTRDDQLAAHRVPPQLIGVIPANTGGFGDVAKAAAVFARNEVEPLQARMLELNDWAGEEVVRFKPYEVPGLAEEAAPPPVR